MALLEVEDLAVAARSRRGDLEIVHGIELRVAPGETVGLVGETGSGKSLTMLALMRLLAPPLAITRGRVAFEGRDLTALPEHGMQALRGSGLAMIYQDPMTSLNPLMRIGDQVAEAMTAHGVATDEARRRTLELLARVEIPDPQRTARAYPHEFSGGMRQRAVIAIALAMSPRLLIADEPTTALDVTIQQQILALVEELRHELGMATIWVTHDLGVVARLVGRVVVMYAGHIVEDAPVDQLFHAPQHPYTKSLLAALPNAADDTRPALVQIPGRPPLPTDIVEGCPFRPRCPQARDVCLVRPALLPRHAGRAACWVPVEEWHA
ncbi:MAG TPA: ABC transporter ATP-binding protein [Patescibacteria group bacterium]|nr:ABC transporter ATP-binding protein [Patescibacteria group bacterium]